jgi:hypothetical protein
MDNFLLSSILTTHEPFLRKGGRTAKDKIRQEEMEGTSSSGSRRGRLFETIRQGNRCRIFSSKARNSSPQREAGAAGEMPDSRRLPIELHAMQNRERKESNGGFVSN